MFPNSIAKNQQGFLLPLAIFIVVVMGIFALVLTRNTIQTNTSATLEAISTQAFYAAESGAQRGMQRLFFPDASVRQQVDQRCVDMGATPIALSFGASGVNNVPGLNSCSITISCACVFADDTSCAPVTAVNYSAVATASKSLSFYQITSVATCGWENLRSVRTIEAGSFLKQE